MSTVSMFIWKVPETVHYTGALSISGKMLEPENGKKNKIITFLFTVFGNVLVFIQTFPIFHTS